MRGKAFKFGDNISTDHIAPGRLFHLRSNLPEFAKHVLEDADPEFASKMHKGDFVVAGNNFGLGSSREHAPQIIKIAGVGAVIAKSFARIFYRNAINIGLLAIECDTDGIDAGDELDLDIEKGMDLLNISRKMVILNLYKEDFMKIQNITLTYTNRKDTSVSFKAAKQPQKFNNSAATIYGNNHITYPIPLLKSQYSGLTEDETLTRQALDSIFRDNELFDETRDFDTNGYSIYEPDDVKAPKHFFNPIDSDYILLKDEYFDINDFFNTDLETNAVGYKDLQIARRAAKQKPQLDEKYLPQAYKLNRNGKSVINPKLKTAVRYQYDILGYPADGIIKIADAAKLRDADGNEHVDYALFEEGFSLADKYCDENYTDAALLMSAAVLDDENHNEYYSPEMLNFEKELLSNTGASDVFYCSQYAISYDDKIGCYFDVQKADRIKAILIVYPVNEAKRRIKELSKVSELL